MLLKGIKGVTGLIGAAFIAVLVIYWFDLDDKIVAKLVPMMQKKAEQMATAQKA